MNEVDNPILINKNIYLNKAASMMRNRAGKSKELATKLIDIDPKTKDILLLHYFEKTSLLLAELSDEKERNLILQASINQ